MPRYVKNSGNYKEVKIDAKKVKEAYKKKKSSKKFPTSINLPEDIVAELKSIATKKGIPYQVLMRMLVIEGLEKLRAA